jgi:hypothetical protein
MRQLDRETQREPTQATQPKGKDPKTGEPYEPIDFPVPKRSAFDQLLERAENPPPRKDP